MRLLPLVALAACIDMTLPPIDLDGPTLVSVTPDSGQLLPLDPTLQLTFSEPLSRLTIEPFGGAPSGTILLMTRYKLDANGNPVLGDDGLPEPNLSSSMITDLNAGDNGLDAASYFARTVPSRVTLEDDDLTVTLRPQERLRADTEYMLVVSSVVRDAAGNRLGSPPTADQERDGGLPHAVRVFQSAAGPPRVIGGDLPSYSQNVPGGSLPTNRASLRIEFDRDMAAYATGDARLVLGENLASVNLAGELNGRVVSLSLPTLDEQPDHANRCLEADGAWRLCPSSNYRIVVNNMRDTEGNLMETNALRFSTTTGADESAPALVGDVAVVAGETSVVVHWDTDEPSTSEVVVMGTPDRTVVGAPCSGEPCSHTVVVDGLSIGQEITLFVRSADLALNVYEGEDQRVTTVDLPDVTITEVLAASGFDPDNSGEYIELHNYGQDAVDLSGWVIQRVGSESAVVLNEGTQIDAGGFLLVVGNGFAVDSFPGLAEGSVMRTESSKLFSFGLSNSDLTIAMVDAEGRAIADTPRLVSTTGRSKNRERLDADTFCDGDPSPGRWTANACQ